MHSFNFLLQFFEFCLVLFLFGVFGSRQLLILLILQLHLLLQFLVFLLEIARLITNHFWLQLISIELGFAFLQPRLNDFRCVDSCEGEQRLLFVVILLDIGFVNVYGVPCELLRPIDLDSQFTGTEFSWFGLRRRFDLVQLSKLVNYLG